MTAEDRAEVEQVAGVGLDDLVRQITDALDPDRQHEAAAAAAGVDDPTPEQVAAAARQLITDAVQPIAGNPDLREKLVEVRRSYEQVIDTASADRVISGEYSREAADRARGQTESFRQFIDDNKDEITALAGALQPALRRRAHLRRHQGTGPSHRAPAPPLDDRERYGRPTRPSTPPRSEAQATE